MGDVASSSYPSPGSTSVYNTDWLYRIGAHYDLGETSGVVGVYVDNRPMPYNFTSAYMPQPQPEFNGIGNRLNLFYGLPIGSMDFGANLTLYHNSVEITGEGANNVKESNTDLGLELGLTAMKNLDIAAGFSFGTWTDKRADGSGNLLYV